MSEVIQTQDVADMVLATLKDLGEKRFNVLANKWRECIVVKHWFRKKVEQTSGRGWQENIMKSFSTAGRHKSVYEPDTLAIPQVMTTIGGSYVHYDTNYPLFKQEILMNSGPRQIFNLVTSRRVAALGGMVEEFERTAWRLPAATDTLSPKGIAYWIVWNATTGFNGGVPSGYTDVGGLDPTQMPNSSWNNYTAQYTSVTNADLVKKMRIMFRKIRWVSPVKAPEYRTGAPDALVWYCSEETEESLIDVQEGRNENLGYNLGGDSGGKMLKGATGLSCVDNELVIRGCPIIAVPIMSDTNEWTGPANPVYGIDHGTFGVKALKGSFMSEGKVKEIADNHNGWAVYIDTDYNYFCNNRRRNGVLATAAS